MMAASTSSTVKYNSSDNRKGKDVMNYIGLMQMSAGGYRRALDNSWSKGFDIVAVPISNNSDCTKDGYDFDPLDVTSTEFNYNFILMFSDQWSLPDSMLNTTVMKKEIDMCRYLQNRNCMLLRLTKEENNRQAAMFNKLKGMLIIEIPGYNPNLMLPSNGDGGASSHCDSATVAKVPITHGDTLRWWDLFNRKLNFDPHLRLIVELHAAIKPTDDLMCRWLSEPLEAVVLPREFFKVQSVTESCKIKGNVTVSLSNLSTLTKLFQHNVNMLVRASPNDPDLEHIANYLKKLRTMYKPLPKHPIGILANRLLVPNTQVLSLWYREINELFKSDTCKYKIYATAVNKALRDLGQTDFGLARLFFKILVVAPLQAPIIKAVMSGALASNRHVIIICLTINDSSPNPKKDLNRFVFNKKIHHLELFTCTIEVCKLKSTLPTIDLIVCEQFAAVEEGSQLEPYTTFELMSCLDPVTGLCIPNNVGVSLCPVMSTRLYNSYRKLEDQLMEHNYHSTNSLPFPSRYVYELASPKLAHQITYVHSLTESVSHRMYDKAYQNVLKFVIDKDLGCTLNALRADYIVTLYKEITLSTHWLDDMDSNVNTLSVMPIYFMFKEPLLLQPGEEISVNFLRRINGNKFWYEWSIIGHGTQNCYGCGCRIQHQNISFS